MRRIVVIGEILAEIMAVETGFGFREPIGLVGPFPSGAPAIYIDQAARLGQPCAIVSAVGDDDFGRLNLDRLARDGVDTSGVFVDPDRPTGTAFVRYRPDGARDFVFNIRHSACGHPPDPATAGPVLGAADHLHVMGSSLSSAEFVHLNLATAEAVRARGGTVSFDPNVRKEMLDAPGLRAAMAQFVAMADVLLPSGEELFLLTEAKQADAALAELVGRGVKAIIHKLGAAGVRYRDIDTELFVPGFRVEEVDPTGAGDCFGGAFTALWLRGGDLEEILILAAAAGALAVTRRGPMEGAFDLETLRRFASAQPRIS